MANNIEKVDLIQKMLDKAMVHGAVTGFMEANAGPVKYSGGDEIKIPSIAMDGLKDYDRQLGFAEGDVRRAAYDVLIRKAENSAVRLSGGTELPDQRAYWLGRARSVRPNKTKPAGRADGT